MEVSGISNTRFELACMGMLGMRVVPHPGRRTTQRRHKLRDFADDGNDTDGGAGRCASG